MISDWLDPGKFDILLLNAITILTWKKENLKNHKDPYSTFNIKNMQFASFPKVIDQGIPCSKTSIDDVLIIIQILQRIFE